MLLSPIIDLCHELTTTYSIEESWNELKKAIIEEQH